MSGISVVATITAADGEGDAVAAALAEAAAAVAANEPGCHFYRIARSKDDANVFKVLESYADADAITAHGASDHFKALGRALKGKLAGAPVVERYDTVA
jgi:quinol monooxygenase YgiN